MPARAHRPLRTRLRSTLFLLPSWFSPTSSLRAAFHRARGAKIHPTAEIGYFVILDNLYPELITIEEGATVAARSTILAHDEAEAYAQGGGQVLKPIRIGKDAFVGVHSVVLPGASIGDRAIVGAGSVVTKEVPPGARVAGVPARDIPRESPGVESERGAP